MTIRDKKKDYLENNNSLRSKLKQYMTENPEQKICIFYKDKNVGIGRAYDLLNLSSMAFKRLLNLDIKEIIKGKSVYIII